MSTTYTFVAVTKVSPPKGTTAGGNLVTITGFGFSLATGVLFDTKAATDVTIVSNTSITCRPPTHNSGDVDVTVSGVATGAHLYHYQLVVDLSVGPVSPLPPLPEKNPIAAADGKIDPDWQRWLAGAKQRIETPPTLSAELIHGEFEPDQIPSLPWTQITKTGSTLADIETRDAGDLAIGMLPVARLPPLTGAVTSSTGSNATTAPGTFLVQGMGDASLPNAQPLGALATGLLKNTTTTGVASIASAPTDYVAITASGRAAAQTAAVASVASAVVGAADATYRVGANVQVTTATSHNFAVQVDYTDETNVARTLTLVFLQLAGSTVIAITNVTGAGPYAGLSVDLRCKAGSTITIKTAGTFTTVTYNVEGTLTRVR